MQERRKPRLLALLACLVATGEVTAQAGAQDSAATAEEPFSLGSPAATPVSGIGLNLRGAPIAVSGAVSYDLRVSRAPGESSSVSQLVTNSLSASTYIYQPWFARVNGTLGVTVGRSRGGGEDNASAERFITGNARVDLFPRSRFPFEVHVERNDSRIDSGLASPLDFRTQNFGFSQRYRPPSGAYSLSASFDRREQISAGSRDIQNLLTGDFSTRWKHNELALGLSQSQARREPNDARTLFRSLVGRHQYVPSSELSVSSNLNFTRTEENAAFGASDLSVLQGSSVGVWHAEGSKLALSGSVRGLLLRDAIGDHALESVGLTLGATYELTPKIRFSASGSANATSSDSRSALGFNGSLDANWQGDTRQFMGFRYDPHASASVGGSHTADDNQVSLGGQLGHTLSQSWPVTSRSTLSLSASQSLAVSQSRNTNTQPGDAPTSSQTLFHSLGATWSVGGDNRTAYARATYSDSRDLGGNHSSFQMLNFQLSGNFEFDRNRSLSGNLTLQRAVQRTGDSRLVGDPGLVLGERSSSAGASGEIVYRQLRAFGIPRLRFTSRLMLAQDVLNQPGTFATIPDRETRVWENRLDWLVGRLETQLEFRLSRVDGKRRELLMLRLRRSF